MFWANVSGITIKCLLTRVLLLCKSHNMDALNIILLRRKEICQVVSVRKIQFKAVNVASAARRSSLTQVSNISSARSFLRVGLMTQKIYCELHDNTCHSMDVDFKTFILLKDSQYIFGIVTYSYV